LPKWNWPTSKLEVPPWIGVEVTRQGKYDNDALAQRPFTTWSLAQAAQ